MANMMTRDRSQSAAPSTQSQRPRTLFEALFRDAFPPLPDVTGFLPNIELSEKDGNYVIDMALPGFKPADVDVEVAGNEITISGNYERKQDDRKTQYSEMQQASFSRTVVLPKEVDADRVTASFENGMLHVTAPPASAIAPKKVAIKGEA